MRRLTAVFSKSSRDKDRDDSVHGTSKASTRSTESFTTPTPSTLKKSNSRRAPGLNVDTAPLTSSSSAVISLKALTSSGPQSSASSSGSASLILQTPDEEPVHLAHTLNGKARSWIPWRSGTIKASNHGHLAATAKPKRLNAEDTESDTSEDEEDDDEDEDDETTAADTLVSRLERTPTAVMHAKQTIELLLQNSLRHRITPCPFLTMEPCPPFPRSANSTRLLPQQESLQSSMHKKHLLRCLQDDKPLTISEQTSILPFSLRRIPALIIPQDPFLDDIAPPKSSRITGSSPGVRHWLSRPCFEDRHYVWVRVEDGVECRVVSGSRLAVPELEYSAALEAMAASLPEVKPSRDVDVEAPETHLSVASSVSSHSSNLSSASHRSALPPPPSSLRKTTDSPSPASSPVAGAARRGVRFAEEDKDDNILVGYSLHAKKKREEKAKFLREQEEKRKEQEQRYRIELERQQRELERLEWEKERQAWEKEKRAIEEERKKKMYQDEVLASRNRREIQRAGHTLPSSPSPPERRNDTGRYLRPSYDNRREKSDSVVAKSANEISQSTRAVNSMRNSSRELSSSSHGSRPPSLHSNATDMRPEDMQAARSSVTSFSSLRSAPNSAATLSMPVWQPNYFFNPAMGFPMSPYGMEMPLLPPNAPFMGHSSSRPRSHHSSSNSPSPTRSQAPSNSSSEQIHRSHLEGPVHSNSFPSTPTASKERAKDARRSSMPAAPKQANSYNSSSHGYSRGRPTVPALPSQYHSQVLAQQQQQAQNPWTALPTQNGTMPTSMATTRNSGYDSMRSSNGRRKTTIS